MGLHSTIASIILCSHIIRVNLSIFFRLKKKWKWTEEDSRNFDEFKTSFVKTVLSFPDFSRSFYISADASDTAVAGEIFQLRENGEKDVISFYSRTLNQNQCAYTISEKELFAILSLCQKFRNLLLGRTVYCSTDHESLTFLHTCKLTNSRLSRWYLALTEFDLQLTYIPGPQNRIADYLSRINKKVNVHNFICNITEKISETESQNLNFISHLYIKIDGYKREYSSADLIRGQNASADLIRGQNGDPKIVKIKKVFRDLTNPHRDWYKERYTLHQNLLFRKLDEHIYRLVIPQSLIPNVIVHVHKEYGHFGPLKT